MVNKLIFNKGTSKEITVQGDKVISLTLTEMLNSSDGLSPGATCAAKLTAEMIVPTGLALYASDVEAYALDEAHEYPLGKFYVCEAESANGYKTATIECYDKFCKTEELYESSLADESGGFLIRDVATDIAGKLNVDIAFDFTGYESLTLDGITGYTYRQMLSKIAALMGKNACFDRNGELDFRWYTQKPIEIKRAEQYQGQFNLLAGEAVVDGVIYKPCYVKYRGNIEVEVGDIITVYDESDTGVEVCVMEQTSVFNGGMQSEIYCHGQSEESRSFEPSSAIAALGGQLEKAVKMGKDIKNARGGYFEILDIDGDGVSDTFVLREGSASGKVIIGNKEGIGFSENGGVDITAAINYDGICTGAINADELWASMLGITGHNPKDFFNVKEIDGKVVLQIGADENAVVFRQENDKIVFVNSGASETEDKSMCYITPDSFVIKNLNKIQFGGLSIYPNNDGKIIFSTGGNK